jgi:hypothetical protein
LDSLGLTKRRLHSGLGPAGLRDVEFLVTEEAHTAVAYVISTVSNGRWFIEEAGDRDPSGARVGAMLQAMLARTPHLAQPDIRAWLPHGFVPPQVEVIDLTPTSEVLMMRPLQDRTLPLPPIAAEDVVYWRSDYFGLSASQSTCVVASITVACPHCGPVSFGSSSGWNDDPK